MWQTEVQDCLVAPGEVLIARSNTAELVGRAAMFGGEPSGVVASDLTIRLRPRMGLIPEFLAAYLSFLYVIGHWRNRAGGASSSMKKITRAQVQAQEIPVPPISEQQRLSAGLAEQVILAERARAAAEAQREAAQDLSIAELWAAFSPDAIRDWPRWPLGEVSEIASGITLGRKLGDGATRRVPYLRVANVKDGSLDLTDVYEIAATEQEIRKLRLERGDLLLTEGGDPDKLGRGTCWQDELPECIHQNHIFRVRLNREVLIPEFVSAQIGSKYGKAYFLVHAKQTTGIATINQGVLARFPVVSPPLDLQRKVTARLEQRLTEASRILGLVQRATVEIDGMPAALLRRAFSGEL